jgi:endogenous inhibitor of DNA gyrase (YacG/DUF329 family)
MANDFDIPPVVKPAAGRRSCPVCGKPPVPRHQPFCSSSCANIDLGRWLKGGYRVETDEPAEDGEAEAP